MTNLVLRQWAARGAVVLFLVLTAAGCSLFVQVPFDDYKVVDCRATVVSEDGAIVTIATGSTQGFPRRRYFVCADDNGCRVCIDNECTDEEEDLIAELPDGERAVQYESDWTRYVNRQINSIADGTLDFPESPFALLDGPWCIQGSSIRCEATASRVRRQQQPNDPNFILEPLPDPGVDLLCLPFQPPVDPPEPEPCLAVTCGDGPCETIDLGQVPVGQPSEPRTIKIDNCGGDGAPAVEVRADGTLFADNDRADFTVFDNTCLPDTPEEEAAGSELLQPVGSTLGNSGCSMVVRFDPEESFLHQAHLTIEEIGGTPLEIDLEGRGLGGALTFTDASGDATSELCIESQPSCGTAGVLIGNAGPGRLIVDGVAIEGGGAQYSVTGPLIGALPWSLISGAPDVAIEIEACPGPEAKAELQVTSDEPGSPTRSLEITLSPSPCP